MAKKSQEAAPKRPLLSGTQKALIVGAAMLLKGIIEDESTWSDGAPRVPLCDIKTYEDLAEILEATKTLYAAIERAKPAEPAVEKAA